MTALPSDASFTGTVTEGAFKSSFEDMLAYLRGHMGTDGTFDDLEIPLRQLRIPNGSGAIIQRPSGTFGTSYAYDIFDRWTFKHDGSAGTGTISRVTASPIGNAGSAIRIATSTLTGATYVYFRYRIEAENARKLEGRQFTVACEVNQNSGSAKNAYVKVNRANAADDFSATTTVSTSTAESVATGTETTISDTVTSGEASSVKNGLEIEVYLDAADSTNYDLAGLRVCYGDKEQEYQPWDFADELSACMRYYYKTFAYATAPAQNAGNTGALIELGSTTQNRAYFNLRFPVAMRATPTLTYYNPGAANTSARNTADSTDTGVGGNDVGTSGGRIYTDVDSSDAGDPMALHVTADIDFAA